VRRVLYLTHHFPPVGGVGGLRPAHLTRYFVEYGYEPVVVTGTGHASGRWVPRDDSLEFTLPAGIRIHRPDGAEPPMHADSDRAARWLSRDSVWARWWVEAGFETAVGAARETDIDLIYAAAQPYPTLELGRRLSAHLEKPWLADLGDPWALDEMTVWPSRVHRRLEERKMERVLRSAGLVAMSTPEAAARTAARFPTLAPSIRTIAWGFEPDAFAGPRPGRSDGALRIVHTGHLHTELGRRYERFSGLRRVLGGRDPDVNVLGRSHVYLLEAIDRVLREQPELEIELHLAGVLSADDLAVGDSRVTIRPYGHLTHREAVALMRSADLLFLPMHALPEGRRATIIPGKTYEYLAAEPPILAAIPEGDARDILEAAGGATICSPTDVDALAQAIRRHAADERRTSVRRDADVVERFAYRAVAAELADMFDEILGPPADGPTATPVLEAPARP
jgi:glycosyltransferase involved in cell wall biosynthesis